MQKREISPAKKADPADRPLEEEVRHALQGGGADAAGHGGGGEGEQGNSGNDGNHGRSPFRAEHFR